MKSIAIILLIAIHLASCGRSGNKDDSGKNAGSKEPMPVFKSQANAVDITDPSKGLFFEGECSRNVDSVQVYSLYTPERRLTPEEVFPVFDFDCKADGYFYFVVLKSDLVNLGLVPGSRAKVGLEFFKGSESTGSLNFNY